ncbi:MAG: stage III sporulation protein AE [Tepidanaerobacteraceae bacterium]|nr:stage III sporulation protein AE [Tepidanaerobacteraceae bacterium]
MKKCIFIIAILIFTMFCFSHSTLADDMNEELIDEQLQKMDLSDIDAFIERINKTYENYIPQYELKDMIKIMRSGRGYDFRKIINGSARFILREISLNYVLLSQLIALSIICAVLRNINSAFENDNVGKVTYSVIYLILAIIAIQSFSAAIRVGKETIEEMVSFIQALLPTILALLASTGGITSVAVLNPLIFIGVSAASTWIKDVLLPVIFFTAVLGLVNSFSDRFHVSLLASFLKQICIFLLGLFLSVFLGILVVNGAASATIDGVAVRTAKFASKNFIPIVGGIFSDTVDTIVGCSLILKNAIGFVGMLIVFLITIFPVLKILSLVIIYKMSGAIIQPLGEESMVRCLNDMANSLMLIFISVASVAIMFFVAITVILAAGNIAVMMR